MSTEDQDPLWQHFAPLWNDLREIAPNVLLAGGYGLFLKQQWIRSRTDFLATDAGEILTTDKGEPIVGEVGVPTAVELWRWLDPVPRVTKDLDLVADLDLIASRDDQRRVEALLQRHSFAVVPDNARWQFAKPVTVGSPVVLDFHVLPPSVARNDVRVDTRRVKPQPSLGQTGIHGRKTPEAAGSQFYPFSFVHKGVEVAVPNPVTSAVMKLLATRDRWVNSQRPENSVSGRQFAADQAKKHAQDVCRVVALTTREENDLVPRVLDRIHGNGSFAEAATVFAEHFRDPHGFGTSVVRPAWRTEDLELIQTVLGTWFQSQG